ncbi:hypothetical protein [Rhizobium multihospitium]|uniref:hypothetical protein n=1 Tax=Rhizobium multihospitium TaxID=410764 RepID=UPI001FDA1D1A|nr:hypothetical protein [Rhizobium multihospitium]
MSFTAVDPTRSAPTTRISLTMAACADSGAAVAVLMNAKMAIVEFERFNFDRGKSEFIYAFTLHFQMELFHGFSKK